MSLAKTNEAQGKVLLMEAALRIAERTRSLQTLGIREIGREAGLNPNTFYRHFKDLDDLGLAIIESVSQELRGPLRQLRQQAAGETAPRGSTRPNPLRSTGFDLALAQTIVERTVQLFFEFAAQKPGAFRLGVCELNGGSPALREALREVMHEFASDMVADIRAARLLPMISDQALADLSAITIREMFQMSLDYIEQPALQRQIRSRAESMILMLLTGAVVLESCGCNPSRPG